MQIIQHHSNPSLSTPATNAKESDGNVVDLGSIPGLDYCDIEWFALEINRDHSVVFEIASKYCILDSC